MFCSVCGRRNDAKGFSSLIVQKEGLMDFDSMKEESFTREFTSKVSDKITLMQDDHYFQGFFKNEPLV